MESRFSWTFQPAPRGARISNVEMARRQEALSQSSLFSDLSKRHLRSIAELTSITSFREGAVILKEGASGSSFFVILEGGAKVVQNGRTIRRMASGDFFGEVSLLDPGPRTATVVADTPTVCLNLAGGDFRDVLAREPTLSLKVVRVLARRLRDAQGPRTPA
jgi:CRP/FNR family cyclic AMP-dependent transcriptional regulator